MLHSPPARSVSKMKIRGKIDKRQLVAELARERVGPVPPRKVMVPKPLRKPRHREPLED